MGKAELNLNKLRSRTVGTISTEEALKEVQQVHWSENVISGQEKVLVTKAEKDVEGKCVRLEI